MAMIMMQAPSPRLRKKKLDFFDIFVFDRDEEDGEEEGVMTEHVPLGAPTLDSDDNNASNPTPAVAQQEQPQNSRQPRGTQTGQWQEPATDSEDSEDEEDDEDEDEDSSEDETSSSSNKRPVKTGARRKGDVHSLKAITFTQLEQRDKDGARRVLDLYKDDRRGGFVHICSLFMGGKCSYMCKDIRDLS